MAQREAGQRTRCTTRRVGGLELEVDARGADLRDGVEASPSAPSSSPSPPPPRVGVGVGRGERAEPHSTARNPSRPAAYRCRRRFEARPARPSPYAVTSMFDKKDRAGRRMLELNRRRRPFHERAQNTTNRSAVRGGPFVTRAVQPAVACAARDLSVKSSINADVVLQLRGIGHASRRGPANSFIGALARRGGATAESRCPPTPRAATRARATR